MKRNRVPEIGQSIGDSHNGIENLLADGESITSHINLPIPNSSSLVASMFNSLGINRKPTNKIVYVIGFEWFGDAPKMVVAWSYDNTELNMASIVGFPEA